MYNTILVLNSSTPVTVKDVIVTSKKSNVYIHECDFSTMTYDMLFTSLHEKYSQMELLGNELELDNIVIYNDKLEHTNYFSQIFGMEKKHILHDTRSFESWETLKTFIQRNFYNSRHCSI